MTDDQTRFEADIRLLTNLEAQAQRARGEDLNTIHRPESSMIDLEALDGVRNLQQALLLRFLTPTGELTVLGHPGYGSRLHELIGEPNTQTNRDRAKLFCLQALQAEPRVENVRSLSVTTRSGDRARVDIRATVKAIGEDTPLNLVFPFDFDGGVP